MTEQEKQEKAKENQQLQGAKLKAEAEAKVKTEQEAEAKAKEKKKVDQRIYDKFIELHFLKIDGADLKESSEKEYAQMKKEIEACDGKKPKVNRTCSFKDGVVKLAKGIPVPDEVHQIVKRNAKDLSLYF